jgi:hypothetical protein
MVSECCWRVRNGMGMRSGDTAAEKVSEYVIQTKGVGRANAKKIREKRVGASARSKMCRTSERDKKRVLGEYRLFF